MNFPAFQTLFRKALPSRFYEEAVSEAQRKYMGTLWNTYAFFCLYAEIDGFNPCEHPLKDCSLSLMDKWILSKLNTLISTVDGGLAAYNITDTARALQDFVDVLSNWYVRRGRERYWGSEMTSDKAAAYATLYHVLVTLSKLTAPFTPFVAETENIIVKPIREIKTRIHKINFINR